MNRTSRIFAIPFSVAAFVVGFAQTTEVPASWQSVTFHMIRAGVEPNRYTVKLQADGKGFYWEGGSDFNEQEVPSGALQQISASPDTLAKASASLPAASTGHCETKLKKIAQTGKKTIIFRRQEKQDQCEFNYSDDERVNTASTVFQAMASTMQSGARLAKLHRFDRLGLDAEIDVLISELKDKQAIEVQNIAPVLQSIAQDDRVMERVRRKTARLLQDVNIPNK